MGPPLLLAFIEKSLNYYLHLDPEVESRLSELAGKVLAIELMPFRYYCLITPEKIELHDHYEGSVDTRLRASLLDYLRLGLNQGPLVLPSRLQISGDIDVAQQFRDLLASLYIDWEEQLSHIVGDNVAYLTGQLWRTFWLWIKHSSNSLQLNLSDYLQVEQGLLPPRPELDDFLAAVDQMRDDIERLQLRIARLEQSGSLL